MLELEHIQKAFDGVPVLKDLSLQVEDGEIVSILGPSGCGKTTLLNIILGIVDADQGEIRYSGEDLTRTPMEKRGFNIVFQDYALFPNLNVQQNITYGLRNKPGRRWMSSSTCWACGSTWASASTSSPAARSSGWPWPAPW